MMKLLRRLNLGQRVSLICALFLLPCVVLLALLVGEKNIAIDFARDEISGTRYYNALIPLRKLLQGADDSGPAFESLRRVQMAENSTLASEKNFKALELALSGDRAAALNALRTLAAQVGDSSKLILDPDLDSYYLMDTVVVHMTEDVDALWRCRKLVEKGKLSQAEIFRLNALREQLAASAAALKRNLDVVYAQEGGARI